MKNEKKKCMWSELYRFHNKYYGRLIYYEYQRNEWLTHDKPLTFARRLLIFAMRVALHSLIYHRNIPPIRYELASKWLLLSSNYFESFLMRIFLLTSARAINCDVDSLKMSHLASRESRSNGVNLASRCLAKWLKQILAPNITLWFQWKIQRQRFARQKPLIVMLTGSLLDLIVYPFFIRLSSGSVGNNLFNCISWYMLPVDNGLLAIFQMATETTYFENKHIRTNRKYFI